MLLNTGWEQIQKESKNGKETETKKYRGRAVPSAIRSIFVSEAFAGGSLGFLTPFPISEWLPVLMPVLGSKVGLLSPCTGPAVGFCTV